MSRREWLLGVFIYHGLGVPGFLLVMRPIWTRNALRDLTVLYAVYLGLTLMILSLLYFKHRHGPQLYETLANAEYVLWAAALAVALHLTGVLRNWVFDVVVLLYTGVMASFFFGPLSRKKAS